MASADISSLSPAGCSDITRSLVRELYCGHRGTPVVFGLPVRANAVNCDQFGAEGVA